MNCAVHNQTPAEAYCRTCGKALCAVCKRDVRGVVFCEDCLASRVEGAIPAAAPAPTPDAPSVSGGQAVDPNAPNPAVALMLGFIPGVGAMYAGEFTKAFFHVLVFASLIWAVSTLNGFEPFFGIGIAFWYFYMVFDSYRTARAKQLRQPVPDPFGFAAWQPRAAVLVDQRRERFPTAAVLLIGLGVLFLFSNIFDMRMVGRLWPLLLIYFGAVRFLAVRRSTLCPCVRCQTNRMTGPVVLLTVGVLFLLDQWTDLKFNRTFPAILIAIGAVKLLQAAGSTEGHIEVPPEPVNAAVPPQDVAQESETHNG